MVQHAMRLQTRLRQRYSKDGLVIFRAFNVFPIIRLQNQGVPFRGLAQVAEQRTNGVVQ